MNGLSRHLNHCLAKKALSGQTETSSVLSSSHPELVSASHASQLLPEIVSNVSQLAPLPYTSVSNPNHVQVTSTYHFNSIPGIGSSRLGQLASTQCNGTSLTAPLTARHQLVPPSQHPNPQLSSSSSDRLVSTQAAGSVDLVPGMLTAQSEPVAITESSNLSLTCCSIAGNSLV